MSDAPFFVSGGTLPLSAHSYVERAADHSLLDALVEGRYAYVLNARQMGKSSLCVRTIAHLKAAGVRTAFVDLTRIGGRNVTPDQWYIGLLGEIGRATDGRTELVRYWKENADASPMQRFFGALAAYALPESAAPLVVFIDEVDATRSLPFSADEFFGGVRECFNRRAHDPAFERLTFCLLGAAIPSDLIRDMEASPFNVGERISLRDFTPDEAAAFATGLVTSLPSAGEGLGVRGAHSLIERVVYWTAGHPFLTQFLCARLAETGAKTPADVDRLVEADLFAPSARESNVNLADVGNRVLLSSEGEEPDRHRAEILALYERVLRGKRVEDDESNPRVAILKLSGLVVPENGLLRMRNRIYARVFGSAWIPEHRPDGEARRVKRAYRVGLLRAATAGAALLAVMSGLAANAQGNAHQAENALAEVKRKSDEVEKLNASLTAATERLKDALNEVKINLALAERRQTEAVRSQTEALSAERKATDSAAQERLAHLAAQAAADREARAHADAEDQARAARRAQSNALNSARDARNAQRVAQGQRDWAQNLLYDSDLQLASTAIAEGYGPRALQILAEMRAPGEKPSSAELHDRALLDDGQVAEGHRDRVGQVAFMPNGDMLTFDGASLDAGGQLAFGNSGTVRRWAREDGRLVGALGLGSVPGGVSMQIDPGGERVVVAKSDGNLALFSTDGFRFEREVPLGGTLQGLSAPATVPGRAVAWRGAHRLEIDVKNGRILGDLGTSRTPIALMPNGELLTVVRSGTTCWTPRPDKGYKVRWHTDWGGFAGFAVASPDGRYVAVCDTLGDVAVADAATGQPVVEGLSHKLVSVRALAFSPDGRYLASGGEDGLVRIDELPAGKPFRAIVSRHPGVSALAFSADGASLAVGYADGAASRFDLLGFAGASGEIGVPSNAVLAALSRDGKRVFLPTGNGIEVRDPHTGRLLRTLPDDAPNAWLATSQTGDLVASLRGDGRLRIIKASDGRPILETMVGKPGDYGTLALSLDGRRALIGGTISGEGALTLLNVPGGGERISWKVPTPIGPAAFSPNGEEVSVIAPARDGTVAVTYDARTGRLVRKTIETRVGPPTALAYSPDGATFVVGGNNGWIAAHETRTGRLVRAWQAQSGPVQSVAFTDADTLYSIGQEHVVWAWDRRTWRSLGSASAGNFVAALKGTDEGSVYVGSLGLIQALRPGPASWRPVRSSPTLPDEFHKAGTVKALEGAFARSRTSGKDILIFLVARVPDAEAYNKVVDAYVNDPEGGAALRRSFEVVIADNEEGFRSFAARGKATEVSRAILNQDGYPHVMLARSDGRLVWNGHADAEAGPEHRDVDLGVPGDAWEVETFVRALRRAVPTMAHADAEFVRSVGLRAGAVLVNAIQAQSDLNAASVESTDAVNALRARYAKALAAVRLDEALNLAVALRERDPLGDPSINVDDLKVKCLEAAKAVARAGEYAKAARMIEGAIQADPNPNDGAEYGNLQFAVALYGLAGDPKAARHLIDDLLKTYVPFDAAFLAAIVPGVLEDPVAALAKLGAVATPTNATAETKASVATKYALLEVRAGRDTEVEREMRTMIRDEAAFLATSPVQRRWAHQLLAFALARQGKADEALAELATAAMVFPGDTSDTALLARGEVGPTTFVLLRREILGLIGK